MARRVTSWASRAPNRPCTTASRSAPWATSGAACAGIGPGQARDQPDPDSHPAQWLGPGSNDRLERKLKHFTQHQLPMSSRSESRDILDGLDIQTFNAHMWLGVICSTLGPVTRCPRLASTRSTCAGVGCTRAIGQRLPGKVPPGAGSPCPDRLLQLIQLTRLGHKAHGPGAQIGRASCRERV